MKKSLLTGLLISMNVLCCRSSHRPTDSPGELRIAPLDRVRVSISDFFERGDTVTVQMRVDHKGRIHLHYTEASVAGLTLTDGAIACERALYSPDSYIAEHRVRLAFVDGGPGKAVDYTPFQPGDYVWLKVMDLDSLGSFTNWVLQVDADGDVNTPSVFPDGSKSPPELATVSVCGLDEFQLEEKLIRAFRSANVIPNAYVIVQRVTPAEAAKVKHPGN